MNTDYTYDKLNIRLAKRPRVKIENNTYAYMEENLKLLQDKVDFPAREIVITLWDNTIARISPARSVLYSSGWLTSTTKDRLNKIIPSPFRIYQESGQWFIYNYLDRQTIGLFADNLTIHYKNNQWIVDNSTLGEDASILRKRILKYCKGYILELKSGKIRLPDSSDCWYCSMHTEDEKSLGESMHNPSHLKLHMKESYYVPSLLYNAVKAFPISQMGMYTIQCLMTGESLQDNFTWLIDSQVYSSLKRYMLRQFNLPT